MSTEQLGPAALHIANVFESLCVRFKSVIHLNPSVFSQLSGNMQLTSEYLRRLEDALLEIDPAISSDLTKEIKQRRDNAGPGPEVLIHPPLCPFCMDRMMTNGTHWVCRCAELPELPTPEPAPKPRLTEQ